MHDENGHKFLQRTFHLCFIVQEVYSQSMRDKEKKSNHFLDFEVFSLAASIFKYSSTSSTRVSYFLPIALEILF